MMEKFYCTHCETMKAGKKALFSIKQLVFKSDSDEIHSFTHLLCPDCQSVLVGCWEILGTSVTPET